MDFPWRTVSHNQMGLLIQHTIHQQPLEVAMAPPAVAALTLSQRPKLWPSSYDGSIAMRASEWWDMTWYDMIWPIWAQNLQDPEVWNSVLWFGFHKDTLSRSSHSVERHGCASLCAMWWKEVQIRGCPVTPSEVKSRGMYASSYWPPMYMEATIKIMVLRWFN